MKREACGPAHSLSPQSLPHKHVEIRHVGIDTVKTTSINHFGTVAERSSLSITDAWQLSQESSLRIAEEQRDQRSEICDHPPVVYTSPGAPRIPFSQLLHLILLLRAACLFSLLAVGQVPRASGGSRTTTASRTTGPWMTSILGSSVRTCAGGMAGVTMRTAGGWCLTNSQMYQPTELSVPEQADPQALTTLSELL